MNWRKGLWRLWCALSLCWVISIGAIAWNIERDRAKRLEAANSCVEEEQEKLGGEDRENSEIFNICKERTGITAKDFEWVIDRQFIPEFFGAPVTATDTIRFYFKDYGALVLVPPLVTLGLGLLGAWVVSSFERKGA